MGQISIYRQYDICAMVISFATFSSFMSSYGIKYAPIIFILFLSESSYMKT